MEKQSIRLTLAVAALAFTVFTTTAGARTSFSDAQVKAKLIEESIARYPGNCPCPYNTMRNGRRCGGNSAHSRGGGYTPLCYPEDVTAKMVAEWRERH
jgi:hypothetical protein